MALPNFADLVPESSGHPKFESLVPDDQQEGPGVLKSLGYGAMSGVPGAETALSALRSIDPNTTYEQAHQGLEAGKDAAHTAHPYMYDAGKVAGLVGTGIAAPEGLLGAAAVGGMSGVDAAERPADMLEDAAKGAGTGVALGGALKGLGALANKALPAVGTAGKAAVSMLGKELSPNDVQSYVDRPDAINNALKPESLSEDFAGTIGKMGQDTQQMSAQAANGLSNTPTTSVEAKLKPIFDQLKAGYMQNNVAKNDAAQSAINALDAQYQRLVSIAKANGGNLSETEIKDQISGLQDIAKNAFTTKNGPAKADAIKNLSGGLNGVLKTSGLSPEDVAGGKINAYGEAMEPVKEQTGLQSDVMKKFDLNTDENGKVTPGNNTMSRIMNAIKDGKSESYDMIDHVSDLTGIDWLQKIQDSSTAARFGEPGLGFGSLGKIASKAVDGGQVAKSILNKYISARGAVSDPVVQKYGSILANAAKQGGNQLAATHFVLSTSDPVYQKLAADQQDPQ